MAGVIHRKKYELVAPDGGWGYVICVAAIINFVTTTSFIPCFGLLYNDMLIELGVTSTGVTLLNGIGGMSAAIGGYLTSPFLNLMGMRQLMFIAAISFNAGNFFLVYTKSILIFFVCQGFLQGFGTGIIFNLTYTMVNDYFVEKRLLMLSVIQTVTAVFAMFAPQLVNVTMTTFGYRGMLLFVSAVCLQLFVAVALVQPVSWHMKKKEVPYENELQVLLLEKTDGTTVPTIALTDAEHTETRPRNDSKETDKNNFSSKSLFSYLFDVEIFKVFITSFACWGLVLSFFSDITFGVMLPQALYANGLKEETVASSLSLSGFGDLAARSCFILFSKFLSRVGNQELFVIGLVISTISKIGFLFSSGAQSTLAWSTLLGVARCFAALSFPLAMSEVIDPENFTKAMGLLLFFMGLANLCLGPIIGVIRDYTDSYLIAFYVLTTSSIVITCLWAIKLLLKRKRKGASLANK